MSRCIAVALALAAFSALAPVTAQAGIKPAEQPCAITIGWEKSEPFTFRDDDGTVRGLDADIARLVAERAGCGIEFKERPWPLILSDVMEGGLTAAMGATRTADRDAFARFSTGYRQESMALVVAKSAMIGNLAGALKAGKVGVVIGYEYGPRVKAAMSTKETGVRFEPGLNDDDNLQKVADGRLSAAIVNPYIATAHIRTLGLEGKVQVLQRTLFATPVKMMVSKKAGKATFAKLEQALESLRSEGTLDLVINAYNPGS